MSIGLAVLTAYGSTTIDRLTAEVFATPEAYVDVIPPELAGRPFNDGLVVAALEAWAAGEAAQVLGGIFLAAAIVMLVALPPALAMGRRARILTSLRSTGDRRREAQGVAMEEAGGDDDRVEPTLAL
jgi:hypothetical protein